MASDGPEREATIVALWRVTVQGLPPILDRAGAVAVVVHLIIQALKGH